MHAKTDYENHTQKWTGWCAMVWDEASWLSCREMGQTESNRKLKLDPPTDSSKTGDSPECREVHNDRINVAIVLH